jgi:predicted metalloprotease with PDZ domain
MKILNGDGFPMRTRIPIVFLLVVVFSLSALAMAPDNADAVKKKIKERVGYLGVSLQELTDEIIDGLDIKIQRGVLVNEVFDGSPAEDAGIRDGDVIIVYDGMKIGTPGELIKLVQKTDAGEKVKMKVVRGDDKKSFVVTIGERPERFAFDVLEDDGLRKKLVSIFKPGVQLGVKIQNLDDEDFAEYFEVETGEGVLVMGVIEDSAAEDAGVKAGDVIVQLNDEDIEDSEELIDEVREMEAGDEFELVVIRHGREMTLSGEIKEGDEYSRYIIKGDGLDDQFDWTHKLHIDKDAFKDARRDFKDSYRFHIDRDELRDELEELRDELKKLKDELKDKLRELEEE